MAVKRIDFTHNGVRVREYKLRYLINDDNREPNKPRYTRIALKWDWHYADVFTVQPVPKSRKAKITNGGHRYNALLLKYPDMVDENGKDITVLCTILPADHDACDAFITSNEETKAPTANERFKRRLDDGKRPELSICRALNKQRVQMVFITRTGQAETGTTRCASKWLDLYKACGSRAEFAKCVECMRDVYWRPDKETIENAALTSDFVAGLAMYVKRTKYTILEAFGKLAACDVSSADLIRRAEKKYFTKVGYSRAKGVAQQINYMIGGAKIKGSAPHKQSKAMKKAA